MDHEDVVGQGWLHNPSSTFNPTVRTSEGAATLNRHVAPESAKIDSCCPVIWPSTLCVVACS